MTRPDVCPPDRMTAQECDGYRAAADLATRLFPGAIGEVLAEALRFTAECGYRVGTGALARRLVAALADEQRRREQQAAAEWAAGKPGNRPESAAAARTGGKR